MDYFGGLVVILSGSLGLYLLAVAFQYFEKLWWRPHRIQKVMAAQGIRGPPYKLFHGNTKEIFTMQQEAMGRPLGLSHDIFSYVQPHLHLWVKQYGKNFLTWLGTRPQLVITEPELCKEVLNNKDNAYPKAEVEPFLYKILGDGLGTSSGEKWSRVRKIANHAFHGESLKNLFPTTLASAQLMMERWENREGKEIEVFEEFRVVTSEAISRAAFGSSYKEGEKIFEILYKLTFLIFRNVYKPRIPLLRMLYKTSDDIESDRLEKEVRDSVLNLVRSREKKALIGEEDGFGNDFLGNLVKSMHDANEKTKIKPEDLVDECKTVYFAGQETVNSSLAWTVFLLALNPDWQEEARKEVLQIFGKENPHVDGIGKLKTLTMVINEALRLYPPIVIIERKAGKEVRLGNIVVPAEVELIISALAVQHEPEFWGPESLVFKPERFSEGVLRATNNSLGKFLPFGFGPRNCVGSSFAYNELKIVLSMILQRYSFTLSPAYVHSPFRAVTVRPQHGLQIMLHAL